jgi:hypothetical protein
MSEAFWAYNSLPYYQERDIWIADFQLPADRDCCCSFNLHSLVRSSGFAASGENSYYFVRPKLEARQQQADRLAEFLRHQQGRSFYS